PTLFRSESKLMQNTTRVRHPVNRSFGSSRLIALHHDISRECYTANDRARSIVQSVDGSPTGVKAPCAHLYWTAHFIRLSGLHKRAFDSLTKTFERPLHSSIRGQEMPACVGFVRQLHHTAS